jgi:hypothetical protein
MKTFKQYITEVERYDYGGDDGSWILDGLISMPYNGIFSPLTITQSTGSDADDPSGRKRYGLPGMPRWPWGQVYGNPDNPPEGWRIKEDASDPPPGSVNDNFWEWMEWYWQNFENVPRPTTPGNWRWDPGRQRWYNPDAKPIDPTRWYRPTPTPEQQSPEVTPPTPSPIRLVSPPPGSQNWGE